MRSGQLDRSLTIQRLTETVAASGAVGTAWAPLATTRADVSKEITEGPGGPGEVRKTVLTVTMRWRGDVTLGDQIVFEGKAFNITGMSETGRRRGLVLKAVAA